MNTYQAEDKLLELFDEVVFKSAMLGIYRLTKRAAALSGTEDSGKDETRHQNDTTANGGCQDGMGRT